ncbi:NAD(P)H-quinone oxidoreductase subunit 2 [Desulfovibrio sp. X2]|uniref:NADH-quinone oxidoreductase subunit N n=1 Tax=Desulfovibrio sp. X2 TaxID=941449 RepID=UPI000358AC7C|nr:NADH-quinone oxidoreductase subunit N [Desulfovibrio sp. X2]EPR43614.1 NAD(P)H-quinone oxidoreductase subunit 2 [Desulfovibrio sp. X2]
MNFDLLRVLPELFQLLLVLGLFVQTCSSQKSQGEVAWVPAAAGFGVLVAAVSLVQAGSAAMFHGAYQIDAMSQFFKLAVALGFFVAVLNGWGQKTLADEKRTDYLLFLGLSAWGLMLLASSVELVTMFVALEVSSYSLFAVVPLRARSKKAAEAGIKYILFGAAASAVSLFGLSYIIAGQHTTYIAALAAKPWGFSEAPVACLGLALFLAGFFYKLALFPFHFWAPDVYDGTSNETAAFVATLPKLGAVVVLVRLAALLHPGVGVTTFIAVLGALSMTFGNLAALAQTDLKRLLGYSSVAHAGYVTLGLVAGTSLGLAAAAFYSLVYLLMNLTCFWVICRVADDGRNLSLSDLDGLARRAPGLALILLVAAFALVGLPPTAGFTGKLYLLTAAWDRGYDWLVIVAALNTAISIYYYLNMVRHAYTHEPENAPAVKAHPCSVAVGGLLAACVLALGVFPARIFDIVLTAGKALLH